MWNSLAPVALGGLIGIVGSLATSFGLERVKRNAERRSLTGAILGEIEAIAKIADRRQYVEGLRAAIAKARAGSDPKAYFYSFSVRRNFFKVYDANLEHLGLLRDPLPSLITQFYAQASSILEDIDDMRESKWAGDHEESAHRLEQLLQLFEETRALARQILSNDRA